MTTFAPLVINYGQLEQLQPGDNVAIPLDDQVAILDMKFRALLVYLADKGFEFPGLLDDLELALSEGNNYVL